MLKYLPAEFLGTFALVLVGTGAIIVNDVSGGAVTSAGIALAFGLIVAAMICAVGGISGAHLNPAVTLGFFLARRFPARRIFPYVAAQCAGAVSASLLLLALFPLHPTLGATLPAGSPVQAFGLEIALTLILMLVILSVSANSRKGAVAIAVGATVALEAYFAGPLTGASMNPARSLAPALVSGHLENLWVYLAAPLLGAALAVFACRCTHEQSCCPRKLAYE